MFCSCRISTDKRVARSLCNSKASCFYIITQWITWVLKFFASGTVGSAPGVRASETNLGQHFTNQPGSPILHIWPTQPNATQNFPIPWLLIPHFDACNLYYRMDGLPCWTFKSNPNPCPTIPFVTVYYINFISTIGLKAAVDRQRGPLWPHGMGPMKSPFNRTIISSTIL